MGKRRNGDEIVAHGVANRGSGFALLGARDPDAYLMALNDSHARVAECAPRSRIKTSINSIVTSWRSWSVIFDARAAERLLHAATAARSRLPRLERQAVRWLRIQEKRELTQAERERALRDHRALARAKAEIAAPERWAERRRAPWKTHPYIGDRVSLTNLSRSAFFGQGVLERLWAEFRARVPAPVDLSDREIARLIYDLVVAYYPKAIVGDLSADAIRTRVLKARRKSGDE